MATFPVHTFGDDNIKVRFKEPFASKALNEAQLAMPFGVYTGFVPSVSPPSTVLTLSTDVSTNRSLLVVKSDTSQSGIALVTENNITLDFSGHVSFPVYVVAKANYNAGSTTTAQIITQASPPNGVNEVGICRIDGTDTAMVLSFSAEPNRHLPIATASREVGFMPAGSVESLASLVSAPTAHAASHQSGGSDPIKLDDLAEPDDNTDLDSSTIRHGLLPKLSGNSSEFLDGTGAFTAPIAVPAAHASTHQAGGSDPIKLDDLEIPDDNTDLDATAARHGLLPKLSGVATEFLDGTGSFSVPAAAVTVPIGGILPWWPTVVTATPPANFAVCDGSMIVDGASPFNGLRVPDLIGNFWRGFGGAQGGDAGVSNANVDSGGSNNHNHGGSTGATSIANFSNVSGGGSIQLVVDPHSHTIPLTSNIPTYAGLLPIIRIK